MAGKDKYPPIESLTDDVSQSTKEITPTKISANSKKAEFSAMSVLEDIGDYVVDTVSDVVENAINTAIGIVAGVVNTVIGIGQQIIKIGSDIIEFISEIPDTISEYQEKITDTYNEYELKLDAAIEKYFGDTQEEDTVMNENSVTQNNLIGESIDITSNFDNKTIRDISSNKTDKYNTINDIVRKSKQKFVDYSVDISNKKFIDEETTTSIQNTAKNDVTDSGVLNIKNAKVNVING